MLPGDAMLHFAPDGRAVRWSPPHGVRAPAGAVPAVRFDARRNWAFVRALLSDPEGEVQWIFIHRALAAALLHEATLAGDDPAVVARASFIMKQPSDAEVARRPHARPPLLRIRRSAARLRRQGPRPVVEEDVEVHGASRTGGRPPRRSGADALAAFGRLFRGELPLTFVAGEATS